MSPEPRPQIKDILTKTSTFFRDKGFESARLDAELLIAEALKWQRMKLYLSYDYPLSPEELTACRELVKRRAAGEPVAYIINRKDFYNHTFLVSPAVLIPRPETETIVDEALKWIRSERAEQDVRLVDLGTGSGCIALSVLAEIPQAKALAVDVSADALAIARENSELLSLVDRTSFLEADAGALTGDAVSSALGAPADLVLANPPYIAEDDPSVEPNVRKFEPHQALFTSDGGLGALKGWARSAAEIAAPGAFVMFELGLGQSQQAKSIFEGIGAFRDVEIVQDLTGRERFVRAFRK